jgi:hypothetical protein
MASCTVDVRIGRAGRAMVGRQLSRLRTWGEGPPSGSSRCHQCKKICKKACPKGSKTIPKTLVKHSFRVIHSGPAHSESIYYVSTPHLEDAPRKLVVMSTHNFWIEQAWRSAAACALWRSTAEGSTSSNAHCAEISFPMPENIGQSSCGLEPRGEAVNPRASM